MTEYLIAFNDEWVPDLTVEDLREKSKAARALVAEMKPPSLPLCPMLPRCSAFLCVEGPAGVPLLSVGGDQEEPQPRRFWSGGRGRRGGGGGKGREAGGGPEGGKGRVPSPSPTNFDKFCRGGGAFLEEGSS